MGKYAVFLFVVLSVILSACGGETEPVEKTSATMEPATETPVPPITCDSENNPCVEVTFDGENCVVAEPTDNQAGWYVFVFANESEGVAKIEAATSIVESRTLENLAADT